MPSKRDARRSFLKDDHGLEAVEYAILDALMVLGVIGAIAAVGAWVSGVFTTAQNGIDA